MAKQVSVNVQSHLPVTLIGAVVQTFINADAPIPQRPSTLIRQVLSLWIEACDVALLDNQEEALDLCALAGVARPEKLNLRVGKRVNIDEFLQSAQPKRTPELQASYDAIKEQLEGLETAKQKKLQDRLAVRAKERRERVAAGSEETYVNKGSKRLATEEEKATLDATAEERAYEEAGEREIEQNPSTRFVPGVPVPTSGEIPERGVGETPYETSKEHPTDPMTGQAIFKPQRPVTTEG